MKFTEFKESILPVVSVLMANYNYEAVKVFKKGCFCFALVPNCDAAVIGDSVIWLLSYVPSTICVTIEIYGKRPCIIFSRNKS